MGLSTLTFNVTLAKSRDIDRIDSCTALSLSISIQNTTVVDQIRAILFLIASRRELQYVVCDLLIRPQVLDQLAVVHLVMYKSF